MGRREKQSHNFSRELSPEYISTQIYLEKDPTYAMWYGEKHDMFWDSTAFRPDPRELLTPGKKYPGRILLDRENLSEGQIVVFPKKIEVILASKRIKFVNIR